MRTKEEFNKIVMDVASEARLLFDLAQATDKVLNDLSLYLSSVGAEFQHELKKGINAYLRKLKDADACYERFVEPVIFNEGYDKIDLHHRSANELVRLCMIYINKTSSYEEFEKLMSFFDTMSDSGVFTEKVIGRFK